eukprot:Phypoly_transcript_08724.p1 GENE.Phypoly_transcript_08724~~Phypoly_transcript_08724.p1  ORF type:complete len:290 (+),score=50.95 Phypoly_transcript_08724:45-914(+)
MVLVDDELIHFEAVGPTPLPISDIQGTVDHEGAKIWYTAYNTGKKKKKSEENKESGDAQGKKRAVVFLHGGLGNSENWSYQAIQVIHAGYYTILMDSRGHGHSTRDERPFSYDLMATDVLAVLDHLGVEKATLVGWSDGACISLIVAKNHPERVAGVFFFAGNMDPSGVKEFVSTPTLERCFSRHMQDFALLSPSPSPTFSELVQAVTLMQQTQPNFTKEDLEKVNVPVVIVQSEKDEFIKQSHAEYLKTTIPGADLVVLLGVSHFAPLQRPEQFNRVLLVFLQKVMAS